MTRFTTLPWLAALVLVWAAVVFAGRIHLPLLEPEEARYAEIPRQMLVGERFLVPVHDGQDYLDKPPLLYWMTIASYCLFGIEEWTARLPTVLTAWLTVIVVMAWGWRTAGGGAGIAGAVVLTLAVDYVYRAPMATMNGPLGLFVTASLAAGHVAMFDGVFRWRWWLLSAAAAALGILMKGPVALVLVGGPLVFWRWFDRRLARPRWYAYLAWGGLSLALASPWFIAVSRIVPDFWEYFLWKHHVERALTPFDHEGPWWMYLPQLVLGFLPWSLFAAGLWFKRMFRAASEEWTGRATARLALAAGLWGLAFFSMAGSKRPVYLVAIEPLFALAAGSYFWHARETVPARAWVGWGTLMAAFVLAEVAVWLPVYTRWFAVSPVVRQLVRQLDEVPAEMPIYCYGHGWDSVGFILGRDDVKTFLAPRKQEFLDDLAKRDEAVVFVTTKKVGRDFETILPAGTKVQWVAENGQVKVARVAKDGE